MEEIFVLIIYNCIWFRLDLATHYTLITVYSIIIIFGLIGNFAIIAAFLANKVATWNPKKTWDLEDDLETFNRKLDKMKGPIKMQKISLMVIEFKPRL